MQVQTQNPFVDNEGRRMLVFPETGTKMPARSRTVISVAPLAYRKQYTYAGGCIYEIPAAPAGGFSTIKVYDHQVWSLDRTTVDDENPGSYTLLPMGCREVAEDFVSHCVNGNLGGKEGVHPGVMLCAGEEPTDAEIKYCFDTHTRYARWCVNDGHKLYATADHKNITDEHRRQAEWLGLGNVPWKVELERSELKKCPACAAKIMAEALKCNQCQTVLPTFYEEVGLDPVDDPVVAAVLASRRSKAQSQRPQPGQPINPPVKN